MSIHHGPPVQNRARRIEPFDVALVSVACVALVVLWAVRHAQGLPATIGAGTAGGTTAVAMVLAQVRVGLTFQEHRELGPVGLLLVAIPVWFAAAVLAAADTALTVPFTIATGVLLSAALKRTSPGV